MASIREVAKLAGVSPATVSRVINGTANVDKEKKERVLQVISETGFVPNEVARSLFKKSAKMIGLMIPSITNPFFTQLASAIEKTADAYGYRMILCNTKNDLKKEKAALSMLTAMNVDGMIITSSNKRLAPYVEKCEVPVIATDRFFSKNVICDYVHCDHEKSAKMAMERLLAGGCKNIVFVKGPQEISSAYERYQGYRQICKELHLQEQVMECEYDFQAGMGMVEELLANYPDVDGIVACNDMVAISIYKVLFKKQIAVPEKIQIVGFDGIYLSTLITPELTTIAQPINEIGEKAAKLIMEKAERTDEKQEYVMNPFLVAGETTK